MSDNKVITHARFSGDKKKTSEPEALESNLADLVDSGSVEQVSKEAQVELSSSTAGGKPLGSATENEKQVFIRLCEIENEFQTFVTHFKDEWLTDNLIESQVGMVRDLLTAAFKTGELDQSGFDVNKILREGDGPELFKKFYQLRDERDGLRKFLYYVVKRRFGVVGHRVGMRVNWVWYDFGPLWDSPDINDLMNA